MAESIHWFTEHTSYVRSRIKVFPKDDSGVDVRQKAPDRCLLKPLFASNRIRRQRYYYVEDTRGTTVLTDDLTGISPLRKISLLRLLCRLG